MSEPKKFLSVKHIVFMIIVQVLAFNNIPGAIIRWATPLSRS